MNYKLMRMLVLGLIALLASVGDGQAQLRKKKVRPNKMMATSMVVPVKRQETGPNKNLNDVPDYESKYDMANSSKELTKEHDKQVRQETKATRKAAKAEEREFKQRQKNIRRDDGSKARKNKRGIRLRRSR